MSARIASAVSRQAGALCVSPRICGELRRAVQRDPAHQLRRHVVLRVAARLPDALVRVAARPRVAQAACASMMGHSRRGSRSLQPGVQQDRVEDRPEHVVLLLVEGAVADPHRAGAGVTGQVVPCGLGEVPPAVDAVHDLQRAVLVGLQVGDELHELVGLPVQAEPVQRLEGERAVPHPGVAVVPVAGPAGRLRQRRGQGGDRRAGRHVGQALDGQRRALQRLAPAVVGDPGAGHPVVPVPPGRLDLRPARRRRRSAGRALRPRTARSTPARRRAARAARGRGPPRRPARRSDFSHRCCPAPVACASSRSSPSSAHCAGVRP